MFLARSVHEDAIQGPSLRKDLMVLCIYYRFVRRYARDKGNQLCEVRVCPSVCDLALVSE